MMEYPILPLIHRNGPSPRAVSLCVRSSRSGGCGRFGRSDSVATDRVDDLRAVEQAVALLLRGKAVDHVFVLEDVVQRPAAVVLANHVFRDALLARRALEQKREHVLEGHG